MSSSHLKGLYNGFGNISQFVCQFVSLSVCEFVSLSDCQFFCLSFCQFVSFSVCRFVSSSVCQSVSLSVSKCDKHNALVYRKNKMRMTNSKLKILLLIVKSHRPSIRGE